MFRLAEKKNFFLCSKKEKNKTIFSPHLDSNSRSLKSFSRARAERALPPRATMASNPPRAPPLPPLPLPPPGHNPCFFTYDLPTPTTSIDAILDFLSTNHKPSSDLVGPGLSAEVWRFSVFLLKKAMSVVLICFLIKSTHNF